MFLDPHAADFFVDWERVATEVVAVLRSAAGRDPYDRGLSALVGELSLQSEPFRTQWAAHNVRFHDKGTKRLHHPSSASSLSPSKRCSSPQTPG